MLKSSTAQTQEEKHALRKNCARSLIADCFRFFDARSFMGDTETLLSKLNRLTPAERQKKKLIEGQKKKAKRAALHRSHA
jgi:LDH2 family malate/lactate/ureidoglycolate dehydrogenase